jgi:hypothetical protein
MSKNTNTLTVLPPDGVLVSDAAKGAALAYVHGDAVLVPDAKLAQTIEADIVCGERYSRAAAFVALRVGVRLITVRDLGQHGDLQKFLSQHFKHRAERTLRNYIKVADVFLRDAGFKSTKTFKLEDHAAVAPIFEEQLDFFLSPEKQKLDAAQKKLIKWVEGRGLNEILRDITSKAPALSGGGGTGGGAPHKELSLDQEGRAKVWPAQHALGTLCMESKLEAYLNVLPLNPPGADEPITGADDMASLLPLEDALTTLLNAVKTAIKHRKESLKLHGKRL